MTVGDDQPRRGQAAVAQAAQHGKQGSTWLSKRSSRHRNRGRFTVNVPQLIDTCRGRLALFGSTLAGTARPDSDIDLLVELESGREPGLLGLAAMEAELTRLLGGKRVDLRTAQDLSRHFRDHGVNTAEVQYAG